MEEIIERIERTLSTEEQEEIRSVWPRCPLCGEEVDVWYVDEHAGLCKRHGKIRLDALDTILKEQDRINTASIPEKKSEPLLSVEVSK